MTQLLKAAHKIAPI